jgi:hypothetical protein
LEAVVWLLGQVRQLLFERYVFVWQVRQVMFAQVMQWIGQVLHVPLEFPAVFVPDDGHE